MGSQQCACCPILWEADWGAKILPICCHRVKSVTSEIRNRLESGEKIYMHCWGGRGRAGTLGACLLGDLYGIDAEEALLRVQKAFSTRGDAGAAPSTYPSSLCDVNMLLSHS